MKIAFHTNQICLQGTEVALFDYAHFCEQFFDFESVVISKRNPISVKGGAGKNQPLAIEKFKQRFPVFLYDDPSEIDKILTQNHIDVFYAIKKGVRDGIESKVAKTVIHAVFKYFEPHGDIYAYVSKWLSQTMTNGQYPYVPHMINLPKYSGDLRNLIGIPKDAIVFGRYGGVDSFDVEFVHETILKTVTNHKNVHFIFMNTNDFLNSCDSFFSRLSQFIRFKKHPQIHFLPATSSLEKKSQFINSCNAMIHARKRGETFGIAVGEFSMHNCPVITFGGKGIADFESNHIEILGNKCFIYNDGDELSKLLTEIQKNPEKIQTKNWDAYTELYSPQPVMEKFKKVFL